MTRFGKRALLLAATAGFVLLGSSPASAHPLGNFTVNHYDGISLSPDRVDVLSIVDIAEIPTAQEMPRIDTDGSGTASAEELATYAGTECQAVSAAVTAAVDSTSLNWAVTGPTASTKPGVAGLSTLRLTCPLSAPADLSGTSTVTLSDEYRGGRVGWHEITAVGDGVRLLNPPVPAKTVSDELRKYPNDLLNSPLSVRSATLQTEPGQGSTGGGGDLLATPSADPFTRFIASADRYLENLIGPTLTPLVGVLAVLLAVALGSGHALLPGHGKTVMAAYLAGRRGSKKDALIVGATVTGTHTAGVLVLGLLISLSSAIAGEQVLRWLGVVSGLLVAGIGLALLRSALRARRTGRLMEPVREAALVGAAVGHVHAPVGVGVEVDGRPHDHGPAHDHDHDPDHDHDHDHDGQPNHADHDHDHAAPAAPGHSHGFGSHSHGPGQSDSHGYSRGGLIGMGIAGGLVPSPSALVVLLASIGLGRTIFGVLLVFAYGIGMAGTLTAVGLLLVRLRTRMSRSSVGGSLRRSAYGVAAVLPILTAILVLVVGLFLVARGVGSTV